MAQQQTIIGGSAGPTIFYVRNGKQCIRIKPGTIKQTAATKKRSSNFSIASSAARQSVIYLKDILFLKDGGRFNRFTGSFSRWLKTNDINEIPTGFIQSFDGFNINPEKMLNSKWKEQMIINRNNNGLLININELVPEDMMAIPKETRIIKLTVSSVIISLRNPIHNQQVTSIFSIPNNSQINAAITFEHKLNILPGSIILSGYSVQCKDGHNWDVKVRTGYTLPAEMIYAEWIEMKS